MRLADDRKEQERKEEDLQAEAAQKQLIKVTQPPSGPGSCMAKEGR
jgi:hypothetical protein